MGTNYSALKSADRIVLFDLLYTDHSIQEIADQWFGGMSCYFAQS